MGNTDARAALRTRMRLATFRAETAPRGPCTQCLGRSSRPVPAGFVSIMLTLPQRPLCHLPRLYHSHLVCTQAPETGAASQEGDTYLRHSPERWPADRA